MSLASKTLAITSVLLVAAAVMTFFAHSDDQSRAFSTLMSQVNAASSEGAAMSSDTVTVRLLNEEGKLSDPVTQPKVDRTEEEWRERLSDEEYRILRREGTEPAFCGGLLNNKEEGYYLCRGCDLPLFKSASKFESGTGWPSFFQPAAKENILEKADNAYGMTRTEIECARCESHLGHVFNDGPRPTGLRYCLNSAALSFVSDENAASKAEKIVQASTGAAASQPAASQPANASSGVAEAVIAGGCFWCVEAVFEEIPGVIDVVSGYAGGDADNANYKAVSAGRTRHAEAVKITYDPAKVNYEDILRIHFATHDPTTLNRQGADVGPQYRSAIFYADEEQKRVTQAFIDDLNEAGVFDKKIVTTLEPLDEFHLAEAYHQDYVACNPGNPYVRAVALPKVQKVRKALEAGKAIAPAK